MAQIDMYKEYARVTEATKGRGTFFKCYDEVIVPRYAAELVGAWLAIGGTREDLHSKIDTLINEFMEACH